MVHHNDLRDGVADLSGKDFTPAHVHDDIKIFTGHTMRVGKAKAKDKDKGTPQNDKGNQKGDILIRDLWAEGTDSIHDMRVVNNDAISYQSKNLEKCLETAGRKKKSNKLHACINEHRHFNIFVASVDGLLGVESEARLKCITSRLATKWNEPYLRTCRYVKSRVTITLVRATHRCIRGARVPTHWFPHAGGVN